MNLLEQLYSGWNSYTPGAMHDWAQYFPAERDGKITVILFENDSLEQVRELKEQIRAFGGSHFAVHTTDDAAETLEIAKLIFVENSLHFLRHRKFGKQQNLEMYLLQFKNWLIKNSADPDCFCIDGSAVMAAYGLRDCRDLDFLHHGYNDLLPQLNAEEIGSHNSEMQYHAKSKNEIIFDPENFFYYRGIKFNSLENLRLMKTQRREVPKDLNDLALMCNMV